MQMQGLLADLFLKIDAISMTIAVQADLSSDVDSQVCACANLLFATLTNEIPFDETMTTVLEQMVAQFTPPTPPTLAV
ncbi:hypothetical protein [Herpetosiphon gulosus]|uniref:Uncharacterized protein n=1 Tax=Herpetosiphon gulosus TaxID=1973496 RepID=A0ABP9X106_9CHLR